MTWEEKLVAIQAVAGGVLKAQVLMRKPGDWYVSTGLWVGVEGAKTGVCGDGPTPEAAVHDLWDRLTMLEPGNYVISNDGLYRWRDFIWWPKGVAQ